MNHDDTVRCQLKSTHVAFRVVHTIFLRHFIDETEATRPRFPRMFMQEQSSPISLRLVHPEAKLKVCDASLHEDLELKLTRFACLHQFNQGTEKPDTFENQSTTLVPRRGCVAQLPPSAPHHSCSSLSHSPPRGRARRPRRRPRHEARVSPGQDAARVHRLIALSSFSVVHGRS